MIINYSFHGYIRTCLLHLGTFFYFLFSLLSLRLAQVCVHYSKYTIFTLVMNYWFTMQVCNLVHIHARLLHHVFLWENINDNTLNTFG